ncbi:hypothetical protein CEN44_17045 [Fischerella muscicola CCMEE 5323]|uniref:Uncharacterized protein n=1 Tax=Fischerella muscicola CCMEE 5323 TaxID=2019572 RepID=A0A2N6K0J7_FISMU|nr:hypothetical protein CEN44_17045 [Fischerella muscicola CCMEE 5323]
MPEEIGRLLGIVDMQIGLVAKSLKACLFLGFGSHTLQQGGFRREELDFELPTLLVAPSLQDFKSMQNI